MISAYQFTIYNCAKYIRDNVDNVHSNNPPLNAFQLSETLAIAFIKSKEEVIIDIIQASKNLSTLKEGIQDGKNTNTTTGSGC